MGKEEEEEEDGELLPPDWTVAWTPFSQTHGRRSQLGPAAAWPSRGRRKVVFLFAGCLAIVIPQGGKRRQSSETEEKIREGKARLRFWLAPRARQAKKWTKEEVDGWLV